MTVPACIRSAPAAASWTLAILVLCLRGAEAQAGGMPLLPHHAVYKLSLASTSGSKAPADANGLITYDFSGSPCAGYTTAFRQVTALQPQEGDARVSDTRTTTTESGDASKFGFDIRTVVNQGDPEAVKGDATRDKRGGIAIDLREPATTEVDINSTVLFPTEHLSRIIATAESGTRILSAVVYDGSDTGRKVFNTLTVIGGAIATPAPETAAQDASLKAERRWPVTVSYFEQGANDAQPAYVLSFDLYENGVSRALKVDYGNFALQGELVEFKPGATTSCPG